MSGESWSRTSRQPIDRLSRIADAMTQTQIAHPEHKGERCIVLLCDDEEQQSGMVIHGYEEPSDVIVDVLMHLRAIFHEVLGVNMQIVAVPTNNPETS